MSQVPTLVDRQYLEACAGKDFMTPGVENGAVSTQWYWPLLGEPGKGRNRLGGAGHTDVTYLVSLIEDDKGTKDRNNQ